MSSQHHESPEGTWVGAQASVLEVAIWAKVIAKDGDSFVSASCNQTNFGMDCAAVMPLGLAFSWQEGQVLSLAPKCSVSGRIAFK